MKTIKIFKPHMEIRIHVTDEMQEDFDECERIAGETGFEFAKDCGTCSWKDCEINGVSMCGKYEEYLIDKEVS